METLFGLLAIFIPLVAGGFWLMDRTNKKLTKENSALNSANDTLRSIKEIDDEAKQIESANAVDPSDRRERMRGKGYLRPDNE